MNHRPPALRRVGLLATALAAATLAGCGDSGGSTKTDPTSELSLGASKDAETELPAAVPTDAPKQPAGLKNKPAGAKAFAGYALEVFIYAGSRRDLSSFLALGKCPRCGNEKKAVSRLRQEGAFVIYDDNVNVRSVAPLYREAGAHVFGVSYDLSSARKIDREGTVIETFPPERKKYAEVAVRYEGDAWKLLDLVITD